MLRLGRLIEGLPAGEQVEVFAAMALLGGDELQAPVAKLGVIPACEAVPPGAGLRQVRDGLVREAGVALEGPEQGLRSRGDRCSPRAD